jgi:hypothetical protein
VITVLAGIAGVDDPVALGDADYPILTKTVVTFGRFQACARDDKERPRPSDGGYRLLSPSGIAAYAPAGVEVQRIVVHRVDALVRDARHQMLAQTRALRPP